MVLLLLKYVNVKAMLLRHLMRKWMDGTLVDVTGFEGNRLVYEIVC